MRSIAVIGTDAVEARLGGYSGPGIEPVSILDGIKQKAGAGVTVRHAAGPGRVVRDLVAVPAEHFRSSATARLRQDCRGEYFDNNRLTGPPRLQRTRSARRFPLDAELARPGHSVRLVFGALDGHADRARRWRETASASKATTAIGSSSTTRW